jgi:indolepyruvate ferredoxin oxidoreductase beta subunit
LTKKTSIVITGVGGQGVITAANLLGKSAVRAKTKVFVSEIHGMAQRGGAVNCTVRFGNVSGPLVAGGTADVILSLEPVEALRNIIYANKNTKIITDINPVVPSTVSVVGEKYPNLDDVYKEIQSYGILFKIDALKIAEDSGAAITKNIVMLGALAATDVLPFKANVLLEIILENIPIKYKDINRRAFNNGFKTFKDLGK